MAGSGLAMASVRAGPWLELVVDLPGELFAEEFELCAALLADGLPLVECAELALAEDAEELPDELADALLLGELLPLEVAEC